MVDKRDLISQLAQEMKMTEEKKEKEEDQFISATKTLTTDPKKSLEQLTPIVKKEEDPWSRLQLKPTDFR